MLNFPSITFSTGGAFESPLRRTSFQHVRRHDQGHAGSPLHIARDALCTQRHTLTGQSPASRAGVSGGRGSPSHVVQGDAHDALHNTRDVFMYRCCRLSSGRKICWGLVRRALLRCIRHCSRWRTRSRSRSALHASRASHQKSRGFAV